MTSAGICLQTSLRYLHANLNWIWATIITCFWIFVHLFVSLGFHFFWFHRSETFLEFLRKSNFLSKKFHGKNVTKLIFGEKEHPYICSKILTRLKKCEKKVLRLSGKKNFSKKNYFLQKIPLFYFFLNYRWRWQQYKQRMLLFKFIC